MPENLEKADGRLHPDRATLLFVALGGVSLFGLFKRNGGYINAGAAA
jgi:hypothetical protein